MASIEVESNDGSIIKNKKRKSENGEKSKKKKETSRSC